MNIPGTSAFFVLLLAFRCAAPPVFLPRCGTACSTGSRLWDRVERVARPLVAAASWVVLLLCREFGRAEDTLAMTAILATYQMSLRQQEVIIEVLKVVATRA